MTDIRTYASYVALLGLGILFEHYPGVSLLRRLPLAITFLAFGAGSRRTKLSKTFATRFPREESAVILTMRTKNIHFSMPGKSTVRSSIVTLALVALLTNYCGVVSKGRVSEIKRNDTAPSLPALRIMPP